MKHLGLYSPPESVVRKYPLLTIIIVLAFSQGIEQTWAQNVSPASQEGNNRNEEKEDDRKERIVGAEKVLDTVIVWGNSVNVRTYDRAEIDAIPKGNHDLTSLIASHPAVRLNPSLSGNGNRGSLAPEAFSIHGESPYQNQFLIDGINGTNAISPQESNLNLQVGTVPGFSQAYNIDSELLDQVQVYDSRIPIEFGHFQGGVVDARIKTPKGNNSVGFKHSYNSSGLTKQRMPSGVLTDWENGKPGYSAYWKKNFDSLQSDIRLTDNTAMLISISRRDSQIERQSKVLDKSVPIPNGKTTIFEKRDQQDRVDNIITKLHSKWDAGTHSNLLFKYGNRQEDLVSNFFADTGWNNRQRAMGLALEVIQPLNLGTLTTTLGADHLDNQRNSAATEFTVQQFENNQLATYTSGGFGNESLDQRQYTGKLRIDWQPFTLGSVQHRLYSGFELQSTRASFVRHQDVYANNVLRQINGQQLFKTRTYYRAGIVAALYNSAGLYLSDAMQWGNWNLTTSARIDRDNLLSNTNVAPRVGLDWDVLGSGDTRLNAGWARYYGLDLLGYSLQQGKSELITYAIQNSKLVNKPASITRHSFDGLKTPYSDEFVFGINQKLSPLLEANISYINRRSRNNITLEGGASKGYFYANNGSGKTETLVAGLRLLKPWQGLSADWHGRIDYSWQNAHRNHNSTQAWEAKELADDDIIEVNGSLIPRRKMPSLIFDQPQKLSAEIIADWRSLRLTWGNRFNWKSSREGIYQLDTKNNIERYKTERLPDYWTWDSTIAYRPDWLKGVLLSVEVLNVMNEQVPVAVSRPTTANNVRYQTGREIWMTAGYEF